MTAVLCVVFGALVSIASQIIKSLLFLSEVLFSRCVVECTRESYMISRGMKRTITLEIYPVNAFFGMYTAR